MKLVRAALGGLAGLPVRVLATSNRPLGSARPLVPDNARLVEWLSYSAAMPLADVVVCHGGHGTLARALACGVPVVAVPHAGDMAENGMRLQWAGAGLSLPGPLLGARSLRWVVERVLEESRFRRRAGELGEWSRRNDAGESAASLVERFARARAMP